VWRDTAAPGVRRDEAGWRFARWAFLREVARAAGEAARPAVVVTGHTADDQAESVLMRVLRGAGARGLAGMAASTPGVVRPLLGLARDTVAAYAAARGLAWVDDPANASDDHLRNRVRQALPVADSRGAELTRRLVTAGHAAAAWRAEVDAVAARLGARRSDGALATPLAQLAACDDAALRVLWPALAARAGAVLDRRGTARLAAFTTRCVARRAAGAVPTGEVPLAGGGIVAVEAVSATSPERAMVLRRRGGQDSGAVPAPVALAREALRAGVRFGRWRFAVAESAEPADPAGDGAWRVRLPSPGCYVVRAWRSTDRMAYRADGAARRVKRFLTDRRVPAVDRGGWPVVVAVADGASSDAPAASRDDYGVGVIVWIPGVRRSPAAPARPGEPGLDLICERLPEPS
jgi:tRNA(Ile)-lysidine synthase